MTINLKIFRHNTALRHKQGSPIHLKKSKQAVAFFNARTLGFWEDDLGEPVVGKAGDDDEEVLLPSQFPCYNPFDPPPDPPAASSSAADENGTEAVDNDDEAGTDERTLDIANTLHHDHCYSHHIPYFSSHLPIEERSHDVPPGIKVEPMPCVPIDLTVDDAVPTLDLSQSTIDLSQCDQLLSLVEQRDPNFMLVDWPRPVYLEDYKQLSEGVWIGNQLLDFYLYHVHQNLSPASQNDIYLFTTDFYGFLSRDKERHPTRRDVNLFDKEHQLISYYLSKPN